MSGRVDASSFLSCFRSPEDRALEANLSWGKIFRGVEVVDVDSRGLYVRIPQLHSRLPVLIQDVATQQIVDSTMFQVLVCNNFDEDFIRIQRK